MSDREIGIISDTHGLIRPALYQALANVERIIHAGDIGAPSVLEDLNRIAPVVAVRGNGDRGTWAEVLPVTELVQIGDGLTLYVLHDLHQISTRKQLVSQRLYPVTATGRRLRKRTGSFTSTRAVWGPAASRFPLL